MGILKRLGNLLTKDIQDRLKKIQETISAASNIAIDEYMQKSLFDHPRYADPKKLNKYEFQLYSQNGEDGIIQEIFKRVGTTNKFFVEFGVEHGLECNSCSLLFQNWKGCWFDAGEKNIKTIQKKFRFLISKQKLSVKQSFVTAENVEELFNAASVPEEFDLLSIDIDGNDYWVWRAIKSYAPRVVIIEYNAVFKPPIDFIVKYDANKVYSGTSYSGASLKSLEILGRQKGYKLVGCNFTGVNAFFVRKDLAGEKFLEPFTAETHYEPPRHFLIRKFGPPRDFGEFAQAT